MKQISKISALLLSGALMTGCAAQINNAATAGGNVGRGVGGAVGEVFGGVVTAPIAVAAFTISAAGGFVEGLFGGVGATPSFKGVDNRTIDTAMRERAPTSARRTRDSYLSTVYREAYGANQVLAGVPHNRLFRCTEDATEGFRKVLRARGVPDAQDYVITATRSQDQKYTLYALVKRPGGALGSGCSTTTPPRRTDIVVDWLPTETRDMFDPSLQAIFMAGAANSAAAGRAAGAAYWSAQSRWESGGHIGVINDQRTRFNAIVRDNTQVSNL